MNVGKRFEIALEKVLGYKRNSTDIAEEYGVTTQAISQLKKNPKSNDLMRKIAKDKGISLSWLEFGEGNMLNSDSMDGIKITSKQIGDIKGTHIDIPYYPDVYGSAGGGAVMNEFIGSTLISLESSFCDLYFEIDIHKGMHLINVTGNSMYPTLDDGDMVFVNPLRFGEDAIDGKIYVCVYENEVFIKRISKNPISKTVTLLSDNISHKGIELTKEETEQLSIIGMVIGSMGRV